MLPAAVMVLMSVWEQLLSPKRTACQAMLFILLAGLGNKHVAAALHGVGVRALPPCIETKCFSVTKHPSLFEPRHRGGGGTHAVRLPERAARGNERSANLPAVHGTAESRHRKFTGNCLRAGGCAVAEMAAARISGGTRVARCQPHPRYLHRVHHLHYAARPGDGAGQPDASAFPLWHC